MLKTKIVCLVILLLLSVVSPSFAGDNSIVDVCISRDGGTGWAIGSKDSFAPALYQFLNKIWKETPAPRIDGSHSYFPNSICVSGDGKKAFAAGYVNMAKGKTFGKLFEHDGISWKPVNMGNTGDLQFNSVCTDKNGNKVWVAGAGEDSGFVLIRESGKWSRMSIRFADNPTYWNIRKIIPYENGNKLFAIGMVKYGSLHDTGLFLKYENEKWQAVDLTPIKNSKPHRRNAFTDITIDEKGTVWVSGWKQYYPGDINNPAFRPMICKFDGKALNEESQENLPMINCFSSVGSNGEIWATGPDEKGTALFSFKGKAWHKIETFINLNMTVISVDAKGQTGFIAGGKKTARDKYLPVIYHLVNGKWKKVTVPIL